MKIQQRFITIGMLLLFAVSQVGLATADTMELKLSRASVPANIPLHKGFYEGKDLYYIVTDANDVDHANEITKSRNGVWNWPHC